MWDFLAANWVYIPGWIAFAILWFDQYWVWLKARTLGLLGSPRNKGRHTPEGCTYICCSRHNFTTKRGERRTVRRIEKQHLRKEIDEQHL